VDHLSLNANTSSNVHRYDQEHMTVAPVFIQVLSFMRAHTSGPSCNSTVPRVACELATCMVHVSLLPDYLKTLWGSHTWLVHFVKVIWGPREGFSSSWRLWAQHEAFPLHESSLGPSWRLLVIMKSTWASHACFSTS
jgi:hypothetical protein